jgi:hypothetical protein
MNVRYQTAHHVETAQIDEEWIVLNTANYSVTKLNDSGGFCLSLLTESRSVDFLAKALMNRYEISWEQAVRDLGTFLPELQRLGLVEDVPVSPEELRRGDVALYISGSHSLIGHRLHHVIRSGHEAQYVFKGDANPHRDEPVKFEHIIGKLVEIHKSNAHFRSDHWALNIWKQMIMAVPLASHLFRLWLKTKRKSRDFLQKVVRR